MLSIATPDSHGNFLINALKVNNEDTTMTQFDVVLVPSLVTLNNIQSTTKFITTFSASALNRYFFPLTWAWPASYSWICVAYVPILLALIRPVFCIGAIVEANWKKVCKRKKTLPFWTEDPRLHRTTPVLPIITEISRFEMILPWISDIYEFFKSITLFINWM